MAASPPRPASPASRTRPVVAPKPAYNLQISPNLEALLQHDELTRRNSSSPTSSYYTSPSSEFSVSLPPPPPRKANGGRKAVQREQEAIPTRRSKEGQRQKSGVVGSDFWPDALPSSSPQDSVSATSQSTSGPSPPMSQNPYLNPTPVLEPIDTLDLALTDEAPTPKAAEKSLPHEPNSESSRSAPETRGRVVASDPSHRPSTALHKVEKILWMGRDSLSLFSGSANGVKRDSDRRNDRAESTDLDAVQGNPILLGQKIGESSTRNGFDRQMRFGDRDIATVTSSSKSGASYLHALQPGPHSEPSEAITSHSTHPELDLHSDTAPVPSLPPTHLPPRLSLPSIFMSNSSSQRPQTPVNLTGNDYLSFIDFFSPDSNMYTNSKEISSSRPRPPSINIPPPSIYTMSHHNHSSTTLASMKFAPPSPTSLSVQQPSLAYAGSTDDSSPVALSAMVFAPPSPSVEQIPTRLQPLSDPPSPFSPLEFALPLSSPHEAIDEPSLSTGLGLTPERGRKLKPKKRSKSASPYHVHGPVSPLPPTTNELCANERADRIRRNRKLARVFGITPSAEEPLTDTDEPRVSKKLHSPALAALLPRQKNHWHAMSVSVSVKTPSVKTEPSTPWQKQQLWAQDGRRHSTPLAANFTLYVDDEQNRTPSKPIRRSSTLVDSPETASARSFIDLSDEDVRDDVSELSCLVPPRSEHQRLHHSTSTPSLVEPLDSEAQAELVRRRKREQLAKLHRCLGSRVPPEAINGGVCGPPLPPKAPVLLEESSHERWLRGKKNALGDDFDRGKEELDEREKALKVRRAQKMERVFGTTPPQMLFHARPTRPTAPLSQPASPANANPFVLTLDLPSSSRNRNQSPYVGKTLRRPDPSESSRRLIPGDGDTPQSSPSSFAQSFADSFTESLSGYQQVLAQSSVYLNYQHSLNSLIDIIDRDDRQSLLQLHRFLHCDADDSASEEEVVVNPRRASNATSLSLRSERRHSLPSNASMTSLSSELYASPRASRFQIRRRKAAKLTNFFGVDYRVLVHNILESIEKGVEEERKQGTLQPQEAEVLMHRVRSLRSMKDPFLSP